VSAGQAHLDLVVAAPDADARMPVEAACLLPYLIVHLRRDATQCTSSVALQALQRLEVYQRISNQLLTEWVHWLTCM